MPSYFNVIKLFAILKRIWLSYLNWRLSHYEWDAKTLVIPAFEVGRFKTQERYGKAFKKFMVFLAWKHNLQKLSNIDNTPYIRESLPANMELELKRHNVGGVDRIWSVQMQNQMIFKSEYNLSDYICTWSDRKLITPNYLTRECKNIIKASDAGSTYSLASA